MRKPHLRPFFQWSLGILLAFYTLFIFALDSTSVQHFLAQKVEEQLENLLHSEVSIGQVEVGLFNNVSLRKVVIKDRKGKDFISSELLFGKIEIRPLLHGDISLRNIALLDTHVHLYKETAQGNTNFQYVLDVFKGDGQKKQALNLRINSLVMRRCAVSYHEWFRVPPAVKEFSLSHIDLTDLDANLSLKVLTNDSLNLRVRNISARESCGLSLQKLRFRLSAGRCHAEIFDFLLATPHSKIEQSYISGTYDVRKGFSNLLKTLSLQGQFRDIRLSTEDAAHFIPKLHPINRTLSMSVAYTITEHAFRCRQLRLTDDTRTFLMDADIDVARSAEGFSHGRYHVRRFFIAQQASSALFQSVKNESPPQALTALGDISLHGKGTFRLKNNILFNGNVSCNLGTLSARAVWEDRKLRGTFSSDDLNFKPLSQHHLAPSALHFQLRTAMEFPKDDRPIGSVELSVPQVQIGERLFQNLFAQLQLTPQQGKAQLTLHDALADFHIDAAADLNARWKPTNLMAKVAVNHLAPTALGLTRKWGSSTLSFHANAQLDQLDFKHPEGHLQIEKFRLQGEEEADRPYQFAQLSITAARQKQASHITLHSDFADLEYHGTLAQGQLQQLTQGWLRTLTYNVAGATFTPKTFPSGLSLVGVVKRTDFLQRVLGINIQADQPITIDAAVTPDTQTSHLTLIAPHLNAFGTELHEVSVAARTEKGHLRLLSKARKPAKNSNLHIEIGAQSDSGRIQTRVQWAETTHRRFRGSIEATSHLELPMEKSASVVNISTQFHPTQIVINDSLWTMEPGALTYRNGHLNIAHLALTHADQRIAVAGNYEYRGEGLRVDLRKVDVGYAVALTGFDAVTFGGHATGTGLLRPSEQGKLSLTARLDIPNFHFNNAPLGHALIYGGFEGGEQQLNLDADIREPNVSQTLVKGYVSLGRKELSLDVDAHRTSIGFLRPYVDGIFDQVKGRASGACRIFGSFKSLDFTGKLTAEASAHIPVTGVTYHIRDAQVAIRPGVFALERATLTDSLQGTGEVKGELRHQHLRRMTYDFDMSGSRVKLYSRPYEMDMPFYGTAIGTGSVRLFGGPGQMTADLRIGTEPGSTLTYILDRPEDSGGQLIAFRQGREGLYSESAPLSTAVPPHPSAPTEEETTTDIRLNMDVDIRPSSTLKMVTDIKSGDVATIHGSGPIQASYYNKGNFRVFGTYNIQSGVYDVSIQNLIKKSFTLMPGGVVRFAGDPLDADVNVRASYLVNSASLADLNIGSGFANNTTPVNCLAHFTGRVGDLNLDLDFDLPNVGEDEKMMVRHLIASDEDRTMQVLYLLSVGRFFTYNYTGSESETGSQSSVMMKSLLSSTLSSQINNILSNAIGSSNWTFGANVATGQLGWQDMEVDGSLSGRLLNNRLLVNGKVGYHEREAATTNFVGDFDVHYLLTPTGTINLKAYSETNDRYFTRSALSTQGVGIQFKHDFLSFRSLFSFFRRKKKELDERGTPQPPLP